MPSHQPRPRPLPASRSSARKPSLRARGDRRLREARRVGVSAQRVADQNDVVARRRQRAVGLVGDADRMQLASTVERERLREGRGTASRPCRRSPRRPSTLAWSCGRSYLLSVGGLMGHAASAAVDRHRSRSAMYDPTLAATGSTRAVQRHPRRLTMAETKCQQRRQRRGTAGRARGTEERAAGGQVHVAGVLQVAERHAQPDEGPGLPWARRGAEAQDRVLVRRRSSRDLRIGGSRRDAGRATCSSASRAA